MRGADLGERLLVLVSGRVAANTAARICSTLKCLGLADAGSILGSKLACPFFGFMR
jgi:hypothetical protein